MKMKKKCNVRKLISECELMNAKSRAEVEMVELSYGDIWEDSSTMPQRNLNLGELFFAQPLMRSLKFRVLCAKIVHIFAII